MSGFCRILVDVSPSNKARAIFGLSAAQEFGGNIMGGDTERKELSCV